MTMGGEVKPDFYLMSSLKVALGFHYSTCGVLEHLRTMEGLRAMPDKNEPNLKAHLHYGPHRSLPITPC